MKLVGEILSVYGLYALSAAILIGRYGLKDRAPVVIVAWMMPGLLVVSVLISSFRLLFARPAKLNPPPRGLAEAERLVEKQRQEMFGGAPLETHFASDWARLYARTLEEEARKVQVFAKRMFAYA